MPKRIDRDGLGESRTGTRKEPALKGGGGVVLMGKCYFFLNGVLILVLFVLKRGVSLELFQRLIYHKQMSSICEGPS